MNPLWMFCWWYFTISLRDMWHGEPVCCASVQLVQWYNRWWASVHMGGWCHHQVVPGPTHSPQSPHSWSRSESVSQGLSEHELYEVIWILCCLNVHHQRVRCATLVSCDMGWVWGGWGTSEQVGCGGEAGADNSVLDNSDQCITIISVSVS